MKMNKEEKEKMAERLITEVVNSYITSDDFEKDAIHFVYKHIMCKIADNICEIGSKFELKAFDDSGRMKIEEGDKFQKSMAKLTSEKKTIMKIFKDSFGYAPEDYKDFIDPQMVAIGLQKK